MKTRKTNALLLPMQILVAAMVLSAPAAVPDAGGLDILPQPTRIVRNGGTATLRAQSDIRWKVDASLPREGYRLKVSDAGVEAAYSGLSGRVYALQTLRQLAGDTCRDALVLSCPATLPCCEIEDSPKFPWRGYMLDTSRHFFGKDVIKRALDTMAYHKLNVFHWHMIDTGGWRFPVPEYPELTDACATRTNWPRSTSWGRDEVMGQYGPLFHSYEDIAEVIAYAKERGIEVVPEVDIPGHQGINKHFRFACCQSGLEPEGTNKWHGARADMCVGNKEAFRFYEKVFDAICDAFPSKIIHIGGDEVGGKDWDRCPRCRKVMRERGLKNHRELQNVVMRHFAEYLAKKGRRAIGWDEILEGGEMPKDAMMTHFHSRGKAHLPALAAGHDVVMMPGRATYFDFEQDIEGDPYDLYQVFNGRQSWKVSYGYDPCEEVPEKDRAHVLGLQGCSWTEILCNERELDWSVYPRLSCLAEIGWSYPQERDADAFMPRLAAHRERLVKMGLNAAPLGPLKVWPPVLNPKPAEVKLFGFAVVFAPEPTEDAVTWIADESVPAGGYVIRTTAKPMQAPGRIEVRHSDAAGKALAMKIIRQLATPKNTGVFYMPRGTVRSHSAAKLSASAASPVDPAEFGFSPDAAPEVNAAALQKALDGGRKTVKVAKPGVYGLDRTVFIDSDTTLEFAPGTVLKKMKRYSNVLVNRGAYNYGCDSNIVVRNLEISVNKMQSIPGPESNAPGLRGHFAFYRVKNVKCYNFTCNDCEGGQYCWHAVDFDGLLLDGFVIRGKKDGVHLNCGKNFTIRNGILRTGDDGIAINAGEWPGGCTPKMGSIVNGLVENIVDEDGGKCNFARVITGCWKEWHPGMRLQRCDIFKVGKNVYAVYPMPLGTNEYVSTVAPSHTHGVWKSPDGINFQFLQDDGETRAEVRNVTFRNIRMNASRAIACGWEFGEYARLIHPEIDPKDYPIIDIRVENVVKTAPGAVVVGLAGANVVLDNVKSENGALVSMGRPGRPSPRRYSTVRNITVKNCVFDGKPRTDVALNDKYGSGSLEFVRCSGTRKPKVSGALDNIKVSGLDVID